ncbi:rifin PIR protein, putative [Plasmodium reichenowi]|uniref:Rifin PIR protein, putative n=1 Tax=Plasmodium reichenowi TaxID=5854 RepID=A0A2P9DSV6_PLARE|nr:rifin PIR protein, putative [Plasmodium reichenowi]
MKVHYINILLFAHALNILAHNKNKPQTTQRHTPTNRSLCECELYSPENYDSDPQMKEVMENFNKQTQQRFHEYDERMKTKRQKCKEICDKESQKIILKDKLEKELMDKFATLHTDIQSDAIPTCICEKSVADKAEKFCLNCGMNVGGGVMPAFGAIAGTALYTLNLLKPAALKAAKAAALTEAKDLATQEGMKAAIKGLEGVRGLEYLLKEKFTELVTSANFKCPDALVTVVENVKATRCVDDAINTQIFCNYNPLNHPFWYANDARQAAVDGSQAFNTTLASQKGTLEAVKVGVVRATYASYEITIIASIVAIVVIVLIMVIIYLILRHRRKKKMKKKLQYIKLLEE